MILIAVIALIVCERLADCEDLLYAALCEDRAETKEDKEHNQDTGADAGARDKNHRDGASTPDSKKPEDAGIAAAAAVAAAVAVSAGAAGCAKCAKCCDMQGGGGGDGTKSSRRRRRKNKKKPVDENLAAGVLEVFEV